MKTRRHNDHKGTKYAYDCKAYTSQSSSRKQFKSDDESLKAICEHCGYGLDEHDTDFYCYNQGVTK